VVPLSPDQSPPAASSPAASPSTSSKPSLSARLAAKRETGGPIATKTNRLQVAHSPSPRSADVRPGSRARARSSQPAANPSHTTANAAASSVKDVHLSVSAALKVRRKSAQGNGRSKTGTEDTNSGGEKTQQQ